MKNQDSLAPHRQANWDVLRALMMFFVVVVHMAERAPLFNGYPLGRLITAGALICDPVFFTLSGFFSLRGKQSRLVSYYLKRGLNIVLPLLIYAVLAYTSLFLVPNSAPIPDIFTYTASLLKGPYWFIPALVPFLLITPFLNQIIHHWSDIQIGKLFRLIMVLFALNSLLSIAFGLVLRVYPKGKWLGALIELMKMLAPSLTFGGYFVFYILGYLIFRLQTVWSRRTTNRLIELGLAAWVLDVILEACHITRGDPSELWVFTVVAVFLIFDRLTIDSSWLRKFSTWLGKRSYAIYLTQFWVFPIVLDLLNRIWSPIEMTSAFQWIIWIAGIGLTYLLCLLIATIVDAFVVTPLQHLTKKAFPA